jgi:hypothetical protein
LARGLQLAFLPSVGFVNLVTGIGWQNNGAYLQNIIESGISYAGSAQALSDVTIDTANGLTLISIWKAAAGQDYYSSGDYSRIAATNSGWAWSRGITAGGGSEGNITSQQLTFFGVADYQESNVTIASYVDTPVACRYNPGTGLISWFAFGERTSPDTSAGTSSPSSSNVIIGATQGYPSISQEWLDQAAVVLMFNQALTDQEILQLTATIQNPWQVFRNQLPGFFISSGASTATGTADGTCTVSGVGHSIFSSAGAANGFCAVEAIGAAFAISTGAATGACVVSGFSSATAVSTGAAAGACVVEAIGAAFAASTGAAAGTCVVSGFSGTFAISTGTAAGTCVVEAIGAAFAVSIGTAAGTCAVNAAGRSFFVSTGTAAGTCAVSGFISATAVSTGTAAGTCVVAGYSPFVGPIIARMTVLDASAFSVKTKDQKAFRIRVNENS